jgi:protein-tyrosine phosphatase
VIFEPFDGNPTPCTASSPNQLSCVDVSRAIHQNFSVKTFQLKQYRLWLLTAATISQSTIKEVLELSRTFPFMEYSSTLAIAGSALFDDLKPFVSFSSAFRPPSAGLRSSSPVRGLVTLVPDPVSTRASQQRPKLQMGFAHKHTFGPIANTNECDLVVDGLYIGSEAAARNPGLLASLGITHIVSLNGYETNGAFAEGFELFVVKLRDSTFETLNEDFWEAVNFVKDAIGKGGSVLCHCRRGVSRSAALCVAYLMDTRGLTCDAALAFLKQKRPAVSPGQGFLDQLKEREAVIKRPESGRRRLLHVPSLKQLQ